MPPNVYTSPGNLLSEFDSRNLNNYDLYLNLFSFSNSLVKVESSLLENWLQSLTNCVSFFSISDLENILLTSNNNQIKFKIG